MGAGAGGSGFGERVTGRRFALLVLRFFFHASTQAHAQDTNKLAKHTTHRHTASRGGNTLHGLLGQRRVTRSESRGMGELVPTAALRQQSSCSSDDCWCGATYYDPSPLDGGMTFGGAPPRKRTAHVVGRDVGGAPLGLSASSIHALAVRKRVAPTPAPPPLMEVVVPPPRLASPSTHVLRIFFAELRLASSTAVPSSTPPEAIASLCASRTLCRLSSISRAATDSHCASASASGTPRDAIGGNGGVIGRWPPGAVCGARRGGARAADARGAVRGSACAGSGGVVVRGEVEASSLRGIGSSCEYGSPPPPQPAAAALESASSSSSLSSITSPTLTFMLAGM